MLDECMLKGSEVICTRVGAAAEASVHAYCGVSSAQNHRFAVSSLDGR